MKISCAAIAQVYTWPGPVKTLPHNCMQLQSLLHFYQQKQSRRIPPPPHKRNYTNYKPWGEKNVSLELFCEGINSKTPELSAKEEALYLFNIWQGWQRVVLQNLWCCECSQVLLGHIFISKCHTPRWKQQERPWRNDESQSSRISCNWKRKEKQKPPWKMKQCCLMPLLDVNLLSAYIRLVE